MDLDVVQAGRPLLRSSQRGSGSRVFNNPRGTFRRKPGEGRIGGNEGKYSSRSQPKTKPKGQCFKCGKQGHHAYECRSGRTKQFHNVETESNTDSEFCNVAEAFFLQTRRSEETPCASSFLEGQQEAKQELQQEAEKRTTEVDSYPSQCTPRREMDKEGRLEFHLN